MVSKLGYSVSIPEGIENGEAYVQLAHGQQYSIRLTNNNSTRCHVDLVIDGKHQGTWVFPAYDNDTLEHPANDQGRFTFYRYKSKEGNAVGLVANENLGLVSVTFTPEVRMQPLGRVNAYNTRSAGGTGLSGNSNQQYGATSALSVDNNQAVTLHVRLKEREVVDNGPRPLPDYRSTPVPPPLI